MSELLPISRCRSLVVHFESTRFNISAGFHPSHTRLRSAFVSMVVAAVSSRGIDDRAGSLESCCTTGALVEKTKRLPDEALPETNEISPIVTSRAANAPDASTQFTARDPRSFAVRGTDQLGMDKVV